MQDRRISRIIKRSKTTKEISSQEIYYQREYINRVIENIQKIIKKNPNITEQELRRTVLNNIFLEVKEYCGKANFRGRYFQIEAARKILADKSIIDREYEKIIHGKIEKGKMDVYVSDLQKSCRNLIYQVLAEIKRRDQKFPQELLKMIEKYNNSNDNEKRKIEQKLNGRQTVKDFRIVANEFVGSDVDKIYTKIKNDLPNFEEQLKAIQIETMEFIGERLSNYNLLEKYKRKNDNNMMNCGIPGYTYEVSTGKYKKDEIGIKEVFSREFLQTQKPEDVMMLSLFWQNRYSKESEDIADAIFTIDTLDLWGKIKNGDTDINITDEEIKEVRNKITCLKSLSTIYIKKVKAKSTEETEKDLKNGYKIIDEEDEIYSIVDQGEDYYKKIFDEKLPRSENSLYRDLELYKVILNQNENIYTIRNSILGCKVRSLFDDEKCKNWGVIVEEFKQYKEDEDLKSKYILVGIDHEGFNMPIRLHIRKELLLNFINSYTGETKIPIYEGDKDFIMYHSLISTNMLMPMQKSHKKLINQKYKEILERRKENKNLIEHLRFLKDNDKYPEHLKEEKITPSGKKRVRPARRYLDLCTGEIFVMENNEYRKIKTEKGKKFDGR